MFGGAQLHVNERGCYAVFSQSDKGFVNKGRPNSLRETDTQTHPLTDRHRHSLKETHPLTLTDRNTHSHLQTLKHSQTALFTVWFHHHHTLHRVKGT